jgi:HD-GYP domain-containing protein (c-di-GMP phosphodiesterase class II)
MNTSASISQQCDDLAQLLGTECLPYFLTSQYSNPQLNGIACEAIRHIVRQSTVAQKPIVIGLTDGRHAFAIPLTDSLEVSESRNACAAVGLLEVADQKSCEKMMQIALIATQRGVQLDSQESQLLQAENELNRAFAEREWSRELMTHRAISKRSVKQQSHESLDELKSLLSAEAIAVFLYQGTGDDNHGLESSMTSRSNWTMEDVRLLIQRIQKPGPGDSTVMNRVSISLPHGMVHSCIAVPLGELETIGYVVAINRRKQGNPNDATESRFQARDSQLLHEFASHLLSVGNRNLLLQESEQLVLGTLRAMSCAIEARDPYTHGHSERVAQVAYEIAVRLQLSEVACQEVYLAGILHDIGKIGIPDHVLMKPGKLTADELSIIQMHPEIGYKILEELGKLNFALPGVLYHHERVDGAGYPHGLKGNEIPMMAKILAVSDAFDAMTSSRVYRTAMGQDRAVAILKDGIGKQWDAEVVNACLAYVADQELVLSDGSLDNRQPSKMGDWRKVSQALRVLQRAL